MSAEENNEQDTLNVKVMNLPALVKIGKQAQKIMQKNADKEEKNKSSMKDLFSGGLGKLGAITLGVTGIMGVAKLFISASPMLKSMLKLFQFGIMLVLRPIGDFIGFMLRPIMLMVLTKFILPFYQNALPMMQEMGTLVGETLVPYIEKIFLAFGALGKIIWGLGEYIVSFGTDDTTMKEGWTEMGAIFSTEIAKDVEAVHAVATVVEAMDTHVVNQLKTGWGDLPKIRDAVKPDLTSMNKFASSELIKMMGLLGDKTNVAGVGAANTAVNVGAARGDVTTLKEMKDLWYKTLMSEGGWTKMPDGKTFGQTSISEPQVVEINVTGMNGNYTSAEKYEFQQAVVEIIEKERAKRPR
jgi:hypothetical protein